MSRLVDVQTITDGGSNVVTIGTDLALNGSAVALAPDLASTANAEGAALVGVEDAAANFTATTVEGVLAELQTNIDAGVADGLQYLSGTITFNGGATQSIGTIPLNAVVTDVRVIVGTAWDDAATFTIGNIGQGTGVLADSDDFSVTDTSIQQKLEFHTNDSASNDYSVFYTAASETQGAADVLVFYTQP